MKWKFENITNPIDFNFVKVNEKENLLVNTCKGELSGYKHLEWKM